MQREVEVIRLQGIADVDCAIQEEARQQTRTMSESLRDQLSELPVGFDGADALRTLADKALNNGLEPSEGALLQLVLAIHVFLQKEREKLGGSDEAPTELKGPGGDAAQP